MNTVSNPFSGMRRGFIMAALLLLGWAWPLGGYSAEVSPPAATEDSPVAIGPVPAWVEPQAAEESAKPAPPGSPAQILLSDAQDLLGPDASDYYYHLVIHLLNAEGVHQNSEWSVVYSPDSESVTWHTLKITRDGTTLDRLPTTRFKRLQRELGFEAKIYNGEITAAAVLDDVRVGDTIEVAYTLHRADPVMKGHMTARHYLGANYPIRRQSVVVRTPLNAPEIKWSYFVSPGMKDMPRQLFSPAALRTAMEEKSTGQERVYRWSAEDVPGIVFDSNIAPRAAPYYPLLRCGTFKTWADVVEWAEPLFSKNGTLPANMEKLVEQWKRTLPTPEARLQAAVSWVQNDVRYFAMALGDHNLRPRPLPEICESRFGDCKDKSTLLVALLRELGFQAWPALVNTYWQDRVQEYGPGPFAFNHAIVACQSGGKIHWIDASMKHQRPFAGEWAVPPYRQALILRPGESDLTTITTPDAREPDTITNDRIAIDAATGDATLNTTVTVTGLQADFYRQRMEAVTPEEMSSSWFNFIARFYKRLDETHPPQMVDDPQANRIVITATYRLPGFVKRTAQQQSVEVYAYALRSLLEPVDSRRRHWPYALAGDRFIRQRIELELPFDTTVDQNSQVVMAEGIEYRVEKGLVGRHFVTVNDLRFTGDYVPADRMAVYSDAVDEIIEDMGTSITHALPAAAPAPVVAR